MPRPGTHQGTYSVELELAEVDENPAATFVLDIEYTYSPGRPARLSPWPGEPPEGAELETEADLFLLDGTKRIAIPAEAKAWLLRVIDPARYVNRILNQAAEEATDARAAAQEARWESRREEREMASDR